MKHCPDHVAPLLLEANTRFPDFHNAYHYYFKLKCTCGSNFFQLFESDKRSVAAICDQCAEKSVIYDLALYTSASKVGGKETFVPILETKNSPKSVYIGYEYGEFDEDQEFDRNDITWCQIFIDEEGCMKKVFDDETS